MNRRAAKMMPGSIFGVIVLMSVFGFVFKGEATYDDFFGIPFLGFATVGLVVATRQPRNAVGWLFMLVGFTPTLGFVTSAYAAYALRTGGGSSLGAFAGWVSSWAWFPGIGVLITFALLLFPDGRLLSKRWKVVAYLSGGMIVTAAIAMSLVPGEIEPFDPSLPSMVNPYGIESMSGFLTALEGIAFGLVPPLGLVCASSLAFRFRRASSEQRQQIKWFAYSAGMLVVIMLVDGTLLDSFFGEKVTEAIFLVGMIFPSVGAGIGILKYRLYDIDIVINRTLVYLLLTAILGLAYVGLVVALQASLAPIAEQSDLAIAGSTLAVAALFRPVRSKVQSFIDRRFYRHKYDATATLGEFSSHLRDQVDLESLNRALVRVVGDTMQPAHVSLWIRAGRSSV